jgi:superkiller protein 3
MTNEPNKFQQAIQFYNEGMKLFEKGDLKGAIEAFQQSIAYDPSDPDAFIDLGVALYKAKCLDSAEAAFKQGIELDPLYARPYNNLGVVLFKKQDISEAKQLFEKAIDYDETYIAAHLNLSITHKLTGMANSSIEMYLKALALSAKYGFNKDKSIALTFVEDDADIGNQTFQINEFDLLANDKWERSELTIEDILNTYQQVDEIEEENAIAYYNMGVALYKKKQYEEAIEYYKKAVALDRRFYEAYYSLGIVHEKLGFVDDAAKYYAIALSINPTFACHLSMAVASYKNGNYTLAERYISRAGQIAEEDAESLNNLGHAYYKMARIDEAIDCYNKAIEYDDEYSMAHYNLGVVLAKAGKVNDAIQSYLNVRDTDEYYVPALNNIGAAYESIKNYDKAVEYYQKALDVDPNYTTAYENLFELLKRQDMQK